MPTVRAVDLHPEFQWTISFNELAQDGYKLAMIKASEGPYRDGSYYIPSRLHDFHARAQQAGLITGLYHFLVETNPDDKALAGYQQASVFARAVDRCGGPHTNILVVDFEAYAAPYSYLSPHNGTLEYFVSHTKTLMGGKQVVCYSNRGYWNGGTPTGDAADYSIDETWDAMWPTGDRPQRDPWKFYRRVEGEGWGVPWGGKEPILWQFTPAGMAGSLFVDVDACRVSEERLKELSS